MTVEYQKAPFPWFGGKQHAAPLVWAAMGDVSHYVEPFMGSLANLLRRPHLCNRPYFSETVNDLDGLLVNAWRSIQHHPDATAEAASWPVSEVDLMSRHLWLVRWMSDPDNVGRMRGDPDWCDPRAAGFWLYGQSAWIGSGWCNGTGPWTVDERGCVVKQGRGKARAPGVAGQRPLLGNDGVGVHRPQLREPGVNGKLPHLGNDGQGVHRPQLREPGVIGQLPHLGDDGMGVHRPQLREPGVDGKLPHLGSDGGGVHRPQLREPGVDGKRPLLGNDGVGVHRPQLREPGVADARDWHQMTMPELRAWFAFLAARLRHVRILQGDWRRAVTDGAAKTLPVRQSKGKAGIFLDPPYAGAVRQDGLYACDDLSVAVAVRAWCAEHGPDPKLRIVLAGFAGEGHESLVALGWREVEWFTKGFLRGGMGNQNKGGNSQHRERLWLSPACLDGEAVSEDEDDDDDDDDDEGDE